MRFLCVKQPTKAEIFGKIYKLKPLNPKIENIEDILVTDDFSASELLSRHKEILLNVDIDTEKCKGFPKIVNSLNEINVGGKILILRNGGIGDHIMLLPALGAFRKLFPHDSEIWLAAQKEKHPLFYNNSNINRLFPLPLQFNILLGADFIIDFSSRNDWYDLSLLHMTDSYLNFLGIDYNNICDKTPEITWGRNRSPKISRLFDNFKKASPYKPLIFINWTASNRLRDLPPEKLLFLVKKFQSVLFVVAQPSSLKTQVTKILKEYDNVINYTSSMNSLENYITAIASCDIVLSTDTSTGHIAEALGKPSIVLYGPTRDDLWIRYYKNVFPIRAEYIGKTCQSPCGLTKNTDNGCPEAILLNSYYSPCLLSIKEEEIESGLKQILERI